MLKTVAVRDLKPNRFRRLSEYPILREKVDTLKESIAQTGFWGTIVGRPWGDDVEIAFGHHRLVALREQLGDDAEIQVIVRDLDNNAMVKMMARENMEEWGTSAWVELETIRATIDAYGRGEITLPPIPNKTQHKLIRHDDGGTHHHPYTVQSVAEFLGWTNKKADHSQPNEACKIAFKALDMIDAGFLRVEDVRGLKRAQLAELVKEQQGVYEAKLRVARENEEAARRAARRAAAAPAPEVRRRAEREAAIYTQQAERHKVQAKETAAAFGREAAAMFRDDLGREAVKDRAWQLKPTGEPGSRPPEVDNVARRAAARIRQFMADARLTEEFRVLEENPGDLSAAAAAELRNAVDGLLTLYEGRRRQVMTRSGNDTQEAHEAGMRDEHGSIVGSIV